LTKNSNKIVIDEIKEILSSTSMKEKYEGLLNRELILPYNYKNLYKKFESLDLAIIDLKRSKKITSLGNIQFFMKGKGLIFDLDDFKRILYVVPHFYIYKWEKLQNSSKNPQNELIIEIPNNISARLKVNFSIIKLKIFL